MPLWAFNNVVAWHRVRVSNTMLPFINGIPVSTKMKTISQCLFDLESNQYVYNWVNGPIKRLVTNEGKESAG